VLWWNGELMKQQVDVLIVGGRVAGSSTAIRLSRLGFEVLLLERDTFPSLPAVSSPIIFAPTMKLLDEIGADEHQYARKTPKLFQLISVGHNFQNSLRIPAADGRDYAYAIDRARFDEALWQLAVQQPRVEGHQNFSVTDLLFEDERIVGVRGKAKDGDTIAIRARVVIGADGRFGLVARKVQAKVRDVFDHYPASIYYAYWENTRPIEGFGPTIAAYEGDGTYGYGVFDSADGQTMVGVQGQSNVLTPQAGRTKAFYLAMLRGNPKLWTRLENAQMVTSVRGMRDINNFYHEPGGPGWALVGDAYHQKDPVDGQGIYNALITSKSLAYAMRRWQQGELDWKEAMAVYDETARIKTYAMYRALEERLRMNFYMDTTLMPTWFASKMGAWLMDDPDFTQLLGKMVTRKIHPDMARALTTPLMMQAIAKGPFRDLQKRIKQRLSMR